MRSTLRRTPIPVETKVSAARRWGGGSGNRNRVTLATHLLSVRTTAKQNAERVGTSGKSDRRIAFILSIGELHPERAIVDEVERPCNRASEGVRQG
jgi:hypothetical protein